LIDAFNCVIFRYNPKSFLHSYFIDVSIYQLRKDDLWFVIICVYIHRNNVKMNWTILNVWIFIHAAQGYWGCPLNTKRETNFDPLRMFYSIQIQVVTMRKLDLLKRLEMLISKPAVVKIVVTVVGDVHFLIHKVIVNMVWI